MGWDGPRNCPMQWTWESCGRSRMPSSCAAHTHDCLSMIQYRFFGTFCNSMMHTVQKRSTLGSSDSCCASPANDIRWPQPQMPLDLSASASALPHLHYRSIFSSSGSVTTSAAFLSAVLMQPLLLWADGGRGVGERGRGGACREK